MRDQLQRVCGNDCEGPANLRPRRIQDQAQRALLIARENGLLVQPRESWDEFKGQNPDLACGSEHLVDAAPDDHLIVKVTLPFAFGEPQFGLVPKVISHSVPNLRGEPSTRTAIEMVSATPLEYLDRWLLNREIFEDKVCLKSVIQWRDGLTSFANTQPYYPSVPATPQQITEGFISSGWKPIQDPDSQHQFFYHYDYDALAVDALPRNCYWLDVILCHPDEALSQKLRL